jgi:alkaline phosphatase
MNDQPLENIIEALSTRGYATGMLTTDFMDGATPGAFIAHQKDRGMSHAIWSDLADSPLNFASAGCHDAFEALPDSIQLSIRNNFEVVFKIPEVIDSKKIVYFPERGECDSVNNPERKDYLPATTVFAMDYLQGLSKKGFFLMVEGARIDKSSHANDFPAIVREVLDFDKAVEAALRFAEEDGHTLVIITADHETGALTLRKGDMREGFISGQFSSGGHTPLPVPLYAYGPWSDLFRGMQENNDIPVKIKSILLK